MNDLGQYRAVLCSNLRAIIAHSPFYLGISQHAYRLLTLGVHRIRNAKMDVSQGLIQDIRGGAKSLGALLQYHA